MVVILFFGSPIQWCFCFGVCLFRLVYVWCKLTKRDFVYPSPFTFFLSLCSQPTTQYSQTTNPTATEGAQQRHRYTHIHKYDFYTTIEKIGTKEMWVQNMRSFWEARQQKRKGPPLAEVVVCGQELMVIHMAQQRSASVHN